MKLTAKTIATLKLPAGKTDYVEWDDEIPGFGIRLRDGGSRNWIFQYRLGTLQRRMSLGAATAESFKTDKDKDVIGIRERVAQLQAKVKLGEDPAGVKAEKRQKAAELFEVVAGQYLEHRKNERNNLGELVTRPDSYKEIERHILKHGKQLHGLHFASIEQSTVATRLNKIRTECGPVAANRVRSSWSAMWVWAIQQGIVAQNPVAGTAKTKEAPRERVLTDNELREIWLAAGDDHYGSIIKLLMLTGQRAGEVAGLMRSEIGKTEVPAAKRDGGKLDAFTIDAIDLPPERMKAKKRHVVPLSKPALAILEKQPVRTDNQGNVRDMLFGLGDGPFTGWSRCKERIDQRIHNARLEAWARDGGKGEKPGPMKPWVIHDLRRSVDTGMNEKLGILPHVVEAVLAHTSSLASGKAGVAGTYNHAQYLRKRNEALRLWGDHIMALVGENVVPLQQVAG